jgi:nitrous oxidase accessory protein
LSLSFLCAVLVSLAAAALPAVAKEWPVVPGTLSRTLLEAREGDTLLLLAGVHSGPIRLDRRLRLVGAPGAVLAGMGRGTVLDVAADGVEVRDLEIRGSGADLSQDDATILLREIRGAVVEGCTVEARAFGIYLRGGGSHRITDNRVDGDPSLPRARRGNGIHLWHSEENRIEGNELIDVRDGVYLSFAHRNVIAANHGRELRYGIHYMYSERNVLERNRFHGCTGGIALMFSMGNRIVGNVASGNRDFGILCQQLERSQVEDNELRANGRGLFIESSGYNRFSGNHLSRNGVGAYVTAGSEANVFTANRFTGNLVQAYEDRAGHNTWSDAGRGNWWSDYVGLDWDGDGVGEVPYRLETATSALLARDPGARWLWLSPLLTVLDWWQGRLQVPAAGHHDPYPLVVPTGSSPPEG